MKLFPSFCCFAVLVLSACASYLSPVSSPAPSPPITFSSKAPKGSAVTSRVLIHTASLDIEVNDVAKTIQSTKQITQKYKGYLENSNSRNRNKARASLELRIPQSHLEIAMNEIAALGRVTSRSIEVEDVTDTWIDLQAKLKNMRALRDRLRSLLKQTQDVKEALAVEKELARVQSEIDSLEGKLKAMKQHVAYSKLSLAIRQKPISGPLGVVGKKAWWSVKKLFVIR